MTTTLPERASLAQWLARIERLHPTEIELGLGRVRQVADALGIDSSALVITVAGTNGKGSVCAMLEAIALAAGYRVGLFTSPHLLRFNERIRVQGESVADEAIVSAFEAIETARADVSLTYFEFSALAALRVFAKSQLDLIILEVGLGGRLDAVNIVDADCAVLTSVALDHQQWLGDTREQIGLEKAHVFRPERPAICAEPEPPTSVIKHAEAIGADLWLHGRDFNISGDRQQWSYGGRRQRRNAMAYPALRGANQLINAGAVLAALESIRDRLPVPQQAVRVGLARVELPGRFQVLPGQPAVVLDVAHNPHAAAHLAANLDNMGFFPETYAVFGVMADKDIDGIISALAKRIDHWLVCPLPSERAAPPADLLARLRRIGFQAQGARTASTATSVAEALASVRDMAQSVDRIVVFGSFLTVVDALEHEASATSAYNRPLGPSTADGQGELNG